MAFDAFVRQQGRWWRQRGEVLLQRGRQDVRMSLSATFFTIRPPRSCCCPGLVRSILRSPCLGSTRPSQQAAGPLAVAPPGPLVAMLMQVLVVDTAQRYGELVADHAAQRSRLRKLQVMDIRRGLLADQAGLFTNKEQMALASPPQLLGKCKPSGPPEGAMRLAREPEGLVDRVPVPLWLIRHLRFAAGGCETCPRSRWHRPQEVYS